MILTIIRVALVIFIVFFGYKLWKDCRDNGPKDVPMKTKVLYGIMGCVLNLLDTLGVGSNATQAAFFKFTKLSPDDELPGNGNVIFAIPVGVEALLFMDVVEVDTVTLFSMLIAAMLGGVLGAKVISKFSVQRIRTILSVTLPCVAIVLVMKVNGYGPFGMMGTANGLMGGKLVVAVAVNFILGSLMCAGVGLYAPCMALCALMGLNITVAFPIMMGSCALLMPPASLEFIKAGKYNRGAAVIMTITGIIGVFIAYFVVKSMSTTLLTYLVAIVLIYMAISFIRSNMKDKQAAAVETAE